MINEWAVIRKETVESFPLAPNHHCFGETEGNHLVIAVYSRAQNRGLNLTLPE